MRLILNILLATGCAMAAVGSAQSKTASSTSKSAALDQLAVYDGEWQARIDHLDTPQSKASHDEFRLTNRCLRAEQYLACNQAVNGESKILLVYVCLPNTDPCLSYPIPSNGAPVSPSTVVVSGNRVEFPWQTSEGNKTTYFRIVNIFASRDRIEFRQEYSLDGKEWQTMATGTESRIATAEVLAPQSSQNK